MTPIKVSSELAQRLLIQGRDGNASAGRPSSKMLGCANVVGTSYLRVSALKKRRSEMLNELTCGATANRTDAIGRLKVLGQHDDLPPKACHQAREVIFMRSRLRQEIYAALL
jgi:hypothetical protein